MIDEKQMTLAVDLKTTWVEGWLASEKLNGCRAFWDGKQFWTRAGNVIAAPKWFTRGLPAVPLDGEIWAGRGRGVGNDNSAFKVTSNAVRFGGHWWDETDDGQPVRFAVFDFPQLTASWSKRMAEAKRAIKSAKHAVCVPFHRVTTPRQFVDFLIHVRKLNGEGAMFRNPETTTYETGRSENLLRFKFVNN